MIETLFAASLVATIATITYLRFGGAAERRQLLFRGLLEFTVPLMLTAGLFAILQWRVRSVTDGLTSVSTIRDIEFAIRWIRNARIERLMIPAWVQFGILLALVLMGVIWPNVRSAGLLDGFKKTARWMTRAQIAATLLASFTFFGTVQATNARDAEVRLGQDINRIERAYDAAFAAADEALATRAAAQLLSDPAWHSALGQLAEALTNEELADEEIGLPRRICG